MKKYIAEFFGTTLLALGVVLSLAGTFPVSTPVLAGLIVGLMVYTMGHVSGAHLNPAVTIAALSVKKIDRKDALGYLAAQLSAAFVALLVAGFFVQTANLPVEASLAIFAGEALGTMVLMFAIAAVVYGKVGTSTNGLVIGGAILVGVALSALLGANGILNPALAITLSSLNLAYVIAPIVGSVAGVWLYKKVFI